MRLFPPAYTLARRAEESATIGGYPVPAGSEVVIWTFMTHRDARWYPNPHAFEPDRFAPAAVAARPRCAYLPFGAGARACIGKVFAMIEGQLLLATLARRFTFELAPGHFEAVPVALDVLGVLACMVDLFAHSVRPGDALLHPDGGGLDLILE